MPSEGDSQLRAHFVEELLQEHVQLKILGAP